MAEMLKKHTLILNDKRLFLIRQLVISSEFFAVLIRDDIITDDMAENIKFEKTTHDKAAKFLVTLLTRGPKAFECFILALVETKQYLLVAKLDKDVRWKFKQEIDSRKRELMVMNSHHASAYSGRDFDTIRIADSHSNQPLKSARAEASQVHQLNELSIESANNHIQVYAYQSLLCLSLTCPIDFLSCYVSLPLSFCVPVSIP